MKGMILEFTKLLANCILVLCLGFASFLIIINMYHYKEIRYTYSTENISNFNYIEYESIMKKVDKKMKSVDCKDRDLKQKAESIFKYYDFCKVNLDNSAFNKIADTKTFNTKVIYKSNYEMINKIGKDCLYSYPYNIAKLYGKNVPTSLQRISDVTREKEDIVADNANYLIKSSFQNSAYHFTTDVFKLTVSDRTRIEYDLTVNNYKLLASSLDDIADWYVSEFGGKN